AYVANRAHHADMGGMSPGSMPLATEIFQEGFRLPPVRLVSAGRVVADVLALFLANTRVPAEREGDLMAQWAALRVGADRLRALAAARGVRRLAVEMAALQAYSAALMRATLARLPPGTYRAADVLDDDGRAAPDRVPAASAGSMNNLALGGAGFAYYETLAGGAGAGPHGPGLSAVHTHMTNTMNTPIEALEAYYPLRVRRYAVRRGSGGRG